MKKHRKAIGLLLVAILLVGGTFLATMAYLTSEDTVKNTFTVGKVDIELDEAEVDEYGEADLEADRVKENAYKLLPGHSYYKDPTVTVLEGSEESYVRILVSINKQENLDLLFAGQGMEGFFEGYDAAKWEYIGFVRDGDLRTYEFRYFETVEALSADKVLEPLFTGIIVPGAELDNADLAKLDGLEIKALAQAIQADGFTDADAAWAAW